MITYETFLGSWGKNYGDCSSIFREFSVLAVALRELSSEMHIDDSVPPKCQNVA